MLRKIFTHSGVSTTEADRIFKEMHKLTVALFRLSPAEAVCSKGTRKRWEELANVWQCYADETCEYSIFDLAIHKLYWGVYPEPMRDDYVPLVRMVEDELLSDGPAYKAWKCHLSYKIAFSGMRDQESALVFRGPRPHSHIFHSYQNARFWYNVVYKRRRPGLINPATASMHDMQAAKIQESVYAACIGFEKVIKCLIPDSKNWTEEQWLDDLNIRRSLRKLYNIRYSDYDPDFEILIAGLINKLHYNTPIYLAQLLKLASIPMGIVQKIWPLETDTELKKLFLQAASRAKAAETRIRSGLSHRHGLHSYQKLKASWLYQYVYNAMLPDTSQDKFERKVKKNVLIVAAEI